jgi:hypothetical protein
LTSPSRAARSGRIGQDYLAPIANPYNVTRTIALGTADIAQERRFAAQQRRRESEAA